MLKFLKMRKINIVLIITIFLALLVDVFINFGSCPMGYAMSNQTQFFACGLLPKIALLLFVLTTLVAIFSKIQRFSGYNYIFTFTLCLLLLVSFVLLYFSFNYKKYESFSEPSEFSCSVIPDSLQVYCYKSLAIKVDDEKYCMKIEEEGDQEECLYNLAKERGDISLCLD